MSLVSGDDHAYTDGKYAIGPAGELTVHADVNTVVYGPGGWISVHQAVATKPCRLRWLLRA